MYTWIGICGGRGEDIYGSRDVVLSLLLLSIEHSFFPSFSICLRLPFLPPIRKKSSRLSSCMNSSCRFFFCPGFLLSFRRPSSSIPSSFSPEVSSFLSHSRHSLHLPPRRDSFFSFLHSLLSLYPAVSLFLFFSLSLSVLFSFFPSLSSPPVFSVILLGCVSQDACCRSRGLH